MLDTTFAFVKEHDGALFPRLPEGVRGGLPGLGDGFCDEARRADVEAFFAKRVADMPGGPRNLAKTLERIHLCAALKEREAESLRAFLAKR
jgi:alanyl aminopeptidase